MADIYATEYSQSKIGHCLDIGRDGFCVNGVEPSIYGIARSGLVGDKSHLPRLL